MAPPNVKIKHLTRSPSSTGDTRFPKLDECAHFHYENVELGPIKVLLCDKLSDCSKAPLVSSCSANKENEPDRLCFLVTVISNGKKWVVRRSYSNFTFLDTQLHRCVYDRKYSLLQELPHITYNEEEKENFEEHVRALLSEYLERFSQLAGSLINCGPVLNWFELDNRGNRLIVTDEVAINTPAVAASYVVMPYSAQATDEISFDVGDMISVIDMPPAEESSWWRGKKGFEVGFFPSECVEVIGDKVPHAFKLTNSSTKPVFRRHGKLIAFFRSFLLSRPSRRKLKQSGILKERVFGCDLGEHLLNTGREIPMVLKCCAEFIEEYGIVDGIYRLSGVSSNIQRLRLAFDEDRPINLGDPSTVHDIHSVASLLKMYFRELPNPLLTYQLYDKFVNAVQSTEDVRLLKVRDVVQQLPPPHFRTLQYLLNHLARVAAHGEETGMTPKNIAIVWAPNLLRSRDVENGGVGALHVVGVQAVLTEYLIRFSDLIFDEKVSIMSGSEQEGLLRVRPKSLAISTPTKLLSLEEARARVLSTHLPPTQQKYIEVGGGPDKLPSKYHTVIDFPSGKQGLPKLKKSPSGWKSFFSRGWYSGSTREKNRSAFRASRKASTSSLPHHSAYMQEKSTSEADAPYTHRKKLRTVKSAESLAHCLKESPSSLATHKNDFSGDNSCLSSPHVFSDSTNSLEMTSPLSKSPGLQKHTRSSSHESYFESNSMDIISEPSFEEDEHGLFYYVSQQMQMLQDASIWESDKAKKADAVSMKSCEDFSSPPSDDPVKSSRKQKFSNSEEFAQVKSQKVTEQSSPVFSPHSNYKNPSLASESIPSIKNTMAVSESCDWSPQLDYRSDDCLSDHEDMAIGPAELYETIKNNRVSLISSSDNETDPSDRTIVERYGNAETVLVEVHATQDSSSEEDQQQSASNLSGDLDSVFYAFENPSAVPRFVVDSKSNFSESPIETETQELLFHLSDEESTVPISCESQNAPVENKETAAKITAVSQESESCNNEGDGANNNIHQKSAGEPISESPPSESEVELQLVPCKSEDVANVEDKELSDSSQNSEIVDDTCKLAVSENARSFSINTPPSPVYPPKSLKLQEFQPLKAKIENIPLHSKKKLFSIPSPSSPVEEVRKKFELKASNSSQAIEPQSAEIKFRSKESVGKLSKSFDVAESSTVHKTVSESLSTDLQSKSSPPKELSLSKRHSEPPLKQSSTSPPPGIFKRMSNKYESENSKATPKNSEKINTKSPKTVQQPSLFTQLKIRKLQSLQAESPINTSEPIDPWSDPILDMQEDYHPVISYLPKQDPTTESQSDDSEEVEETCVEAEKCEAVKDETSSKLSGTQIQEVSIDSKKDKVVPESQIPLQSHTTENLSTSSSEADALHLSIKLNESTPESEAVRRERINRIKEERRAQLREKLKQESFRMEAEEKEKVITKFRLRKDSSKLADGQDDVKKSDKAVETDSANITETGTTCDLDSSVESGRGTCNSPFTTASAVSSGIDSGLESFSFSPKFPKSVPKDQSSGESPHSKRSSSRKSARSYEDSRKWLSMPPTDIRDKVAMFERSKDTNELCRLGPNGKFPQKQSTSALTSSFVR